MNLSTNSDQLLVSRLLISLSPVLCRCGDGSIAAALAGELPKEKAGVGIYRSSGVQENKRMKSQMDNPQLMSLSTKSDQLLVSRLPISLSPVLCRCGDASIAAALAGELPKRKPGSGSTGVQEIRRIKDEITNGSTLS